MLKTNKIKSPTLTINSEIAKNNILSILAKLGKSTIFRPHFKTHDNKITANIFRDLGVNKISVSSIDMALYFRSLGFKNINISFPVNFREQKKLQKLSKNTELHLLISNSDAAQMLSNLKLIKAKAWIEIDTGYNRSGILYNNLQEIQKSIDSISKSCNLSFEGFLNHNGSTYSLNSPTDILHSSFEAISKLKDLQKEFSKYYPKISIGDTPTCSLMENFEGIDEIRPGNFVYYDLIMLEKKVCTKEQIAAKVFCPIVDISKERNEIVIHGGAVHFSKEFIYVNGHKSFGRAVKHYGKSVFEISEEINSLSQEHGILKIKNSKIENYKLGDLI
ncbi:MAG: alanine racemase, partial [Bacteroidales bacterium]|nr:alanine racemase [Bacteroidales bacterium]